MSGESDGVDLSSFPLLRIDQVHRHVTDTLVESEAQLSELQKSWETGDNESRNDIASIAPFVSKLLKHIREELLTRQNKVSETSDLMSSTVLSRGLTPSVQGCIGRKKQPPRLPTRPISSDRRRREAGRRRGSVVSSASKLTTPCKANRSPAPKTPIAPLNSRSNNRMNSPSAASSSQKVTFIIPSPSQSTPSNFRSRAKVAKASIQSRSQEAISHQREQIRQDRTKQALETMQEWRIRRQNSKKRREELWEEERRQRRQRRKERCKKEERIRSVMHEAAEGAKSLALQSGSTQEEAMAKAAAAAAKVVDEESAAVFDTSTADSGDEADGGSCSDIDEETITTLDISLEDTLVDAKDAPIDDASLSVEGKGEEKEHCEAVSSLRVSSLGDPNSSLNEKFESGGGSSLVEALFLGECGDNEDEKHADSSNSVAEANKSAKAHSKELKWLENESILVGTTSKSESSQDDVSSKSCFDCTTCIESEISPSTPKENEKYESTTLSVCDSEMVENCQEIGGSSDPVAEDQPRDQSITPRTPSPLSPSDSKVKTPNRKGRGILNSNNSMQTKSPTYRRRPTKVIGAMTRGRQSRPFCDLYPNFCHIFANFPVQEISRSVSGKTNGPFSSVIDQKEVSRCMQSQIQRHAIFVKSLMKDNFEAEEDFSFESDCSFDGSAPYSSRKLFVQNRSFACGLFYRISSSRPEVRSIIEKSFSGDLSSWSELPLESGDCFWNLRWTWGLPKASDFDNLLVFQKINRFRHTRGLTRKDLLKKNIQRYGSMQGNKSDHFNIMPLTYALPHEYNAFLQGYSSIQRISGNKTPNFWIIKPVGLSRGRGISLVNDIDDVSYSQPIVLQRYIHDPLLLFGYKFDLRIYVLVTSFSPLEAFIYREGLARFGTRQYTSRPEFLHDQRIHLTNSSIQKDYLDIDKSHPACLAGSHGAESKVALSWLLKRLQGLGIDTKSLWSQVIEVCVKALVSSGSEIPYQPNSFELFGFDVMFDEQLKCWLIEVNSSPSLGCDSQLDTRIKGSLVRDTIALVDPPSFDRKALADVCERRLTQRKEACNISSNDVLEDDLSQILRKPPRKYGDLPSNLGNYERIFPGTSIFERLNSRNPIG